jgi:transcriptional regulator with XRE-family HTH domain
VRSSEETAAKRRAEAVRLGKLVAAARERRGLSQRELARRTGLTQQALGRVELGARTVTFLEGLDLAEQLGFAPTDLDPRVPETS